MCLRSQVQSPAPSQKGNLLLFHFFLKKAGMLEIPFNLNFKSLLLFYWDRVSSSLNWF